jgi:hypothetical protein
MAPSAVAGRTRSERGKPGRVSERGRRGVPREPWTRATGGAASDSARLAELSTHPGAIEHRPLPEGVPRRLGRFFVLRRLGAGAMGVVHAAYDEELERKVALEVLPRDVDERARARVVRASSPRCGCIGNPAGARTSKSSSSTNGSRFRSWGLGKLRWTVAPSPSTADWVSMTRCTLARAVVGSTTGPTSVRGCDLPRQPSSMGAIGMATRALRLRSEWRRDIADVDTPGQ